MTTNNSDWYARKFGSPRQPDSSPQTGPTRPTVYTPQPQQPNIRVGYDQNQDQLVTRAPSSRETELCPGCMSGNYFAPQGTQRKRCYDCGYPLVQAGTGVGGTGGAGEGRPMPAKQPAMGTGFNPTTIVDRIG